MEHLSLFRPTTSKMKLFTVTVLALAVATGNAANADAKLGALKKYWGEAEHEAACSTTSKMGVTMCEVNSRSDCEKVYSVVDKKPCSWSSMPECQTAHFSASDATYGQELSSLAEKCCKVDSKC